MRIGIIGRDGNGAARKQGRKAEGRGIDVVQRKIDQKGIVSGDIEPLPYTVCVHDEIQERQFRALRMAGRSGGEENERWVRKFGFPFDERTTLLGEADE